MSRDSGRSPGAAARLFIGALIDANSAAGTQFGSVCQSADFDVVAGSPRSIVRLVGVADECLLFRTDRNLARNKVGFECRVEGYGSVAGAFACFASSRNHSKWP